MLTLDQDILKMCEMTNEELDAEFINYGIRIELLKKTTEEKRLMSEASLEAYCEFITELRMMWKALDPKNRQRIEARRAQKGNEDTETIILDGITVGKPW